jgi:hypothetical protein
MGTRTHTLFSSEALHEDIEGRKLLRDTVNDFWTSGSFPPADEIPDAPRTEEEENEGNAERATTTARDRIDVALSGKWSVTFQTKKEAYGDVVSIRSEKYGKYSACTTLFSAWMHFGANPTALARDYADGRVRLHNPADVPVVHTRPPRDELADEKGVVYEEWLLALMKLLSKKGDLHDPKNWRGIALLDIASKIVTSVMSKRMRTILTEEGLEKQMGYMKKMGTRDGTYCASIGLQKRHEHGLATWALFIDLVKAFDSVNRVVIFAVLRKFGMPDHFINLIMRLYTNAKLKIKIGDVEAEVKSTIGVRQGSIEGPLLFIFIFQAAFETMKWPVPMPEFFTREQGVTTGERWQRKEGEITAFKLWAALFADDCALLFLTRSDLTVGGNYIFQHLKRFGLHMHVGRGNTASKTEAMYFPAPGTKYEDGDTTDFTIDGTGFISFTKEFRYLGSIIHYSLTSDADVYARIAAAGKAFGALRTCIFRNKRVSESMKGRVYNALVLSILLYGCESWCMTTKLLASLRTFHRQCVRAMCRVTIRSTIKFHITTTSLLRRVGVQPLHHYYSSRVLRWAGHIARMPMTRMPRCLLTGWVRHPRKKGGQELNWGRTLNKALNWHKLPTTFPEWSKLAQDRALWRSYVNIHTLKHKQKNKPTPHPKPPKPASTPAERLIIFNAWLAADRNIPHIEGNPRCPCRACPMYWR